MISIAVVLAALTGITYPMTTPVCHTAQPTLRQGKIVADSDSTFIARVTKGADDIVLTDSIVKQYGAVQKDLEALWKTSSRAKLERRAMQHGDSSIVLGDSALAGVLAKHRYSPSQYKRVFTSVLHATIVEQMRQSGMAHARMENDIATRNVAFMDAHAQEIKDAGLAFPVHVKTNLKARRNPN